MYVRSTIDAVAQAPVFYGVTGALLAWAVYLVYIVVYRLYFHPYAKYPGPLAGRLSSWWGSWLAYKGDLHFAMKIYHDQYGPVVRFHPDRVTFNSETALKSIYKSREVRKSKAYSTWISTVGIQHIINAIDKKIHARKNLQFRQILHPERVKGYEAHWLRFADELVNTLAPLTEKPGWTDPRNFHMFVERMMLDLMGKVGFGREMEAQATKQYDFLIGVLASTAKWNAVNIQSLSISKFYLSEILYPLQFLFKHKSFQQVRDFCASRIAQKTPPNSMFAELVDIQEKENGPDIPVKEMWVDSTVLMSLLSDQVGSSFCATTFYLSRNPKALERLTQEVRSTFSSADQIHSGELLESCQYLDSTIKEGLRMTPTIGGAPWREVLPQSMRIDDEVIPRGLDVAVGIYSIHHNEKYFPDSYAFLPERWLGEDPKTDLSVAEAAWSPFSLGSRSCVAQAMATLQLKGFIAKLVWSLDMSIPEDPKVSAIGGGKPGAKHGRHRPGEYQLRDFITGQCDGPYLHFRRRID